MTPELLGDAALLIGFGGHKGCRRGALRRYHDSSSKKSRKKGSHQTIIMVVTRDSLLKVELHSSIGDFWACH